MKIIIRENPVFRGIGSGTTPLQLPPRGGHVGGPAMPHVLHYKAWWRKKNIGDEAAVWVWLEHRILRWDDSWVYEVAMPSFCPPEALVECLILGKNKNGTKKPCDYAGSGAPMKDLKVGIGSQAAVQPCEPSTGPQTGVFA